MAGEFRTTISARLTSEIGEKALRGKVTYASRSATYLELPTGQWFLACDETEEKRLPIDFHMIELLETARKWDELGKTLGGTEDAEAYRVAEVQFLLEFVTEYGVPADSLERDLPATLTTEWAFREYPIFGRDSSVTQAWDASTFETLAKAKEATAYSISKDPIQGKEYWAVYHRLFNIAELRYRLVIFTKWIRLWTWWTSLKPTDSQLAMDIMGDIHSEAMEYLNSAMAVYAPRLDISLNMFQLQEANAYSLTALQIALDMNDDVQPRKCERSGCDVEFVRQRGRSKYDQHRVRGEVKYCCAAHGKAQIEQNRRDRIAAEEGRPKRGRGRPKKDTSTLKTGNEA